ncbi:MAG TPA: inositol 2-dehydrogenase [Candidatus Obscuribacterales bacterium]
MNEARPLKIGIIGAGRIGELHAEHLRYRVRGAELAAIADINKERLAALAAALDIPKTYTDYHELLEDDSISAVVICSPTDTHSTIIEESAAAGKHIFCEKPIDHDMARIDRALKAVAKASVKLQTGFNRRFDPNFRHIKLAIENGKIGQPHILKITSRDPAPPPVSYIRASGGLFLDMTIHDFDMARYLMNSEVKSVFATGNARLKEIGLAGDIDTAIVVLEFANGSVGTIDNSREAVYGYDQRVEVFGSQGVIAAENNTPYRVVIGGREGFYSPNPMSFFMDRYTESYLQEMEAFVKSIINDETPPVTGEDGRIPVVIALAAQQSLKERRVVDISQITDLAAAH